LLVDIRRAVALHDLDGAMRLILRLHRNRDDDALALQVIAAFALIQRGAARHGVRLVRPEADLVGVDAARDEIVQHVLRLLQVVHQAYDGFRHFALLGWWKPTSKRDA
jgi:hypothetical protein